MLDIATISKLINEAMQSGTSVFIRYQDNKGEITDREISPLEWVDQSKFLAFCHLRNDERHFNLRNIQELSPTPSLHPQAEPLAAPAPRPPAPTVTAPAPVVVSPTPHPVHPPKKAAAPLMPISRVSSPEEWRRLLDYYRACLHYEHQQSFSMKTADLQMLDLSNEMALDFLSGTTLLEWKPGQIDERLQKFLNMASHSKQQLCCGKAFVFINPGQISPLLFAPVTASKDGAGVTTLAADDYGLSYAALLNLGFDSEEIADYVTGFQSFMEGHPSIKDLQDFAIQSLSQRLSRPLPVVSPAQASLARLKGSSIYDGTGLFMADNHITANLIAELEQLASPACWHNSPAILKALFDQSPEYEHSPAPDFIAKDQFFVTHINAQQRKAARAVTEHPITIVTGPPGTGKSQLVLNLIAQAYLAGQTVLFASHNNKAVDVVMQRLQEETQFQGAIRTGSSEHRRRVVDQMENALSQVHQTALQDFETRYQGGKRELQRVTERLDQIRDLKGKISSYEREKQDLLAQMSEAHSRRFSELRLPFIEQDKQRMNDLLSTLAETCRDLIYQRQPLVDQLRMVLAGEGQQYPALKTIHEYEKTWGRLAGGLFHPQEYASSSAVLQCCQTAKKVLAAMSARQQLTAAQQAVREIGLKIDQVRTALPEEHGQAALQLGETQTPSDLSAVRSQLDEFDASLQKIVANDFSLFQKIAMALRLFSPKRKLAEAISFLAGALNLPFLAVGRDQAQTQAFQTILDAWRVCLELAGLQQEMQRRQAALTQAKTEFDQATEGASPDLLKTLQQINLSGFDPASLVAALAEIEQPAAQACQALEASLAPVKSFFISNTEQAEIIGAFQQAFQTEGEWDAFGLSQVSEENAALAWALLWQQLLVLWEANAVIAHCQELLAGLPGEDQALAEVQQASSSLFSLAGELMRATWFNRTAGLSNITFEGAKNYISAVRQVIGFNPAAGMIFAHLKKAEEINFPHALKTFPVWAITNLTAKTNFPLVPGLFDLVIIDEASQCDIPSALPLIYRAKKLVIIGDPHQLRHVARLAAKQDALIGDRHGVGLETHSYRTHSLYDLGERTAGFHPGPILLEEHFRSDPRIITFSNGEFYAGRLQVKTDLTRRGFSRDYLSQRGGAYWLDVKGKFQLPDNGSAFNLAELEQIPIVVGRVLQALDQNGYPKAMVGVVTPFRAQAKRLMDKLAQAFPDNSRIRIGTAHQFQGDECDVIIFSPVMAAGITSGQLNWLDQTDNLLNVSVTRARVSLVVVGDFEFCNKLPPESRYQRLAGYIQRMNGVVQKLEDLPVLGGSKVEIIGTLLDPVNPEYNRTNLMRLIASCQEYLYWVDPYFDRGLIELFETLAAKQPLPDVKKIYLLTARRQVTGYHDNPPELPARAVARLSEKYSRSGIDFQVRIMPGEQLPHDRFLYYPGEAINMPPFNGAYGNHRRVSEYSRSSTTPADFMAYWEKASLVEDRKHVP